MANITIETLPWKCDFGDRKQYWVRVSSPSRTIFIYCEPSKNNYCVWDGYKGMRWFLEDSSMMPLYHNDWCDDDYDIKPQYKFTGLLSAQCKAIELVNY